MHGANNIKNATNVLVPDILRLNLPGGTEETEKRMLVQPVVGPRSVPGNTRCESRILTTRSRCKVRCVPIYSRSALHRLLCD